jgi:hypothetical protein
MVVVGGSPRLAFAFVTLLLLLLLLEISIMGMTSSSVAFADRRPPTRDDDVFLDEDVPSPPFPPPDRPIY